MSSDGVSLVSAGAASQSAGGTWAASVASRRRRDSSLRRWSISRRAATRISQARGLSGTPSAGHCVAAASSASWVASSASSECP